MPLLAGLALAACGGKPGPEDPAVAAGTGIPMGALSADGVSFDAPVTDQADLIPHLGGRLEAPPKVPPPPVDPFDPEPTPTPIKTPKQKGTSL